MPEASPTGRLVDWLGSWATVIAPVSVVSALLFYFGYVASRAQYEYFGVDVDVIGLGTQAYIMRSPQPLLVPLLVFTMLGAGLLFGHSQLKQWTRDAAADDRGRLRRACRAGVLAGLALLTIGIVLLFSYAGLRNWPLYDFTTSVVIAAGGLLVGYGWRLIETIDLVRAGTAPSADDSTLLRRTARVLLFALTAVSVLWTTATVAQWSGRGLAHDVALHLDRLPRVILDTKEPLYLRSPGVVETILPKSEGQTFRYRYRQLRLLVMGRDHMFLVPEAWSASNSTLIVKADDSVRVQFQFQSEPP